MIIPTLEGWSVGEKVTAAKLTKHTKTAVEALYNKAMCELSNVNAQSIANNAMTAVALPNVVFDSDSMADTANSRIVIKTAGMYRVVIGMGWAANATGTRWVQMGYTPITGTASTPIILNSVANGTNWHHDSSTRLLRFRVGDILTLSALQSSGVTLNTDPGAGGMFLSAEWVAL